MPYRTVESCHAHSNACNAVNGGVFPFARVFETIEGTHELKAHGTREMPIWGKEYRSSKYYDDYLHDADTDRSYFARSRILALTEYIYRLQGK